MSELTRTTIGPGGDRGGAEGDWSADEIRRVGYRAVDLIARRGVAELIERCCGHAARAADRFRAAGVEVLNDVVLNQVLARFGDDDTTRRVIAGTQADGTCWCGGTTWRGVAAMRVSVSSWKTTADDIDRSVDAILGVLRTVRDSETSTARSPESRPGSRSRYPSCAPSPYDMSDPTTASPRHSDASARSPAKRDSSAPARR